MKKITLNKVIDFVLFLYILSLYFLTQQENLNIISNAIALILILFVWTGLLINKKKIRINKFIVLYSLFIFICLVSVLYSIDSESAFVKSRTLILNFILMFSMINYIDSIEKIKKTLYFFVFSGFLTSIYLIFTTDFSEIGRIGGKLGNENAIGIIIALSTIICFYIFLEKKIYGLLPIIITNTISVLLTGSRKSLLFLIISIILILFFVSKNSIRKKVKYVIIGSIVVMLIIYLTFNNPTFYQIIGRRMENLVELILGRGTTEGSLNVRNYMIKFGIDWFKDRPVLGYGIDNYRFLLNRRMGMFTYSHNNVVELLVGVGITGTVIYYLAQVVVIKDLLRITPRGSKSKLNYLFITIILGYIIISISLIYYDNKVFNIILALSSIYPRIYLKESKRKIPAIRKEVYSYEQSEKSY